MYALVLAGGRGERLRPHTSDRPKPMVPINGRPILEYHIEWLQEGGVTDVVILCGYLCEVIMDYFGDGGRWGLNIQYSVEESPLGRGGAFKRGFTQVAPEENVVIGTNGDVITNQPLAPLLRAHEGSGALATVMLVPFVSPYGVASMAGEDRIIGFVEKPELPYWINGGVYIFSTQCYPYLPEQGDHENHTFPRLAEMGRLGGFKSRAFWRTVDTVKDLAEVAQALPLLRSGQGS